MCNFVHFVIQEIVVAVKMLIPKHTLSDDFVGEFPLEIHHELEHLVVGLAGKQDLPCVELEDRSSHGPQVYPMVITHTNNCESKITF